jgi:hypothetical protein
MKDGWYWVKYSGKWEIMQCERGRFDARGRDCYKEMWELDEIGDRIEVPEKYR